MSVETTRAHQRYAIRLGAEVHRADKVVRGATYDVSRGGCRFESSSALPEGEAVTIHLKVVIDDVQDADFPPLVTNGAVRWSAPADGATARHYSGLEFTGLSDDQARWIETVVTKNVSGA